MRPNSRVVEEQNVHVSWQLLRIVCFQGVQIYCEPASGMAIKKLPPGVLEGVSNLRLLLVAGGQELFFACAALRLVGVAAAEFLHAASRVDEHVLASVKRMRGAAHFDFNYWIGVAIFPLNGLSRAHRGTGQKFEVRRGVLKNYLAVLGVRFLFHYREGRFTC